MPCNPSKCGAKCCKSTSLILDNTPEVRAWVKARRFSTREINNEVIHAVVPHVCPELNTATNKCNIHDTKPAICREWPSNQIENIKAVGLGYQESLPRKCTYKWNSQEKKYE